MNQILPDEDAMAASPPPIPQHCGGGCGPCASSGSTWSADSWWRPASHSTHDLHFRSGSRREAEVTLGSKGCPAHLPRINESILLKCWIPNMGHAIMMDLQRGSMQRVTDCSPNSVDLERCVQIFQSHGIAEKRFK